jgi:hypothetical protein
LTVERVRGEDGGEEEVRWRVWESDVVIERAWRY